VLDTFGNDPQRQHIGLVDGFLLGGAVNEHTRKVRHLGNPLSVFLLG
jgi:hypothetical protein